MIAKKFININVKFVFDMSEITHSGFYQDDLGQSVLVTQGLAGYTLVDKKQILFRLFLHPDYPAQVTALFIRIKYIGEDIPPTEILIPSSSLLIENSPPNGPSVGIVLQGDAFPDASLRYFIEFYILTDRLTLGRVVLSHLKFQKSGRLRLIIKNLVGTAPWGNKIEANLGWFLEISESLHRLSMMLPISDGFVSQQHPHPDIGLSWFGGLSIDTWPNPCPSGNLPSEPDPEFPNILRCPADEMSSFCTAEAREKRSQGIRIDVTVVWRPRDYAKFPPAGGENMGGYSPRVTEGDLLIALVGGSSGGVYFTAPLLVHEIGHNFDLDHSNDRVLNDQYSFDFRRLKPYFPPPQGVIENVMVGILYNGMDSSLTSPQDWEHLRQKLVEISSLSLEYLNISERKKKLVEKVQTPFVGIQKIQVETPELSLSSKPGFDWHWTRIGFQRLIRGKPNTNRSGLASSAVNVIFALRELGIKEIYAPIDGNPLNIVINPTIPVTCYNNKVRSSGLP